MSKLFSPKILVVDDEESIRIVIQDVLSNSNINADIRLACNGKDALKKFSDSPPHLIILDYMMPEMDGLEFMKAAKSLSPDIPIIVLTAHGDKDVNLNFLKEGAYRYIEKPFDIDEFSLTIKDAISHYGLIHENKKLQDIIQISDDSREFIGESDAIKNMFSLVKKVADTDATILIQGESGTGKELLSRAIHNDSCYANFPFVPFNCAALPDSLIESELFGYEKGAFTGADKTKLGRFELAQNGTIFIDEIGELKPAIQVKLLRVLQEKTVERLGGVSPIDIKVRIIAATNRDLKLLVEQGKFREDLYYRLAGFPITIPPLRERQNDIDLLVHYFIKKYANRYRLNVSKISPSALATLKKNPWKGNVRELENVVSRAVILSSGSEIATSSIQGLDPIPTDEIFTYALSQKWTEDTLVSKYAGIVYHHCNQSKKEAADFLDINYRTLMNRLSDKPTP